MSRNRPFVALSWILLLCTATAAFAGGPITSGSTVAGMLSGPTYLESWTFSGTNGDRVLIAAVSAGGAMNTNIVVKAPGGGIVINTSTDRVDYQLAATGVFTIEISDVGLNDAGSYALGFVNITAGPLTSGSDLDGGPMVSADVKSGTMSGAADIDCFTFSGTNGQRVLMDGVATAGAGFNTTILLYPPNGGPWLTYTTGDRLDVQLTSTGTWTIVIEDNANDTAGSYSMSLLNVTGGPHENGSDTDGELIVSNDIKTGQFQQGVDFDAFTFAGTAGNRVIVVGLATGAGSHNPQLSVYPPGGGAAEISSATDRFDLQLGQTGTYTLVVEDSGNDDTGTYTIAMMNVTAGPFTNGSDMDGGAIVSADVKTGTMSGPGDIDCFTFSGTNGQRVLMDGVATAGAGFNTTILLYPPNGGPWLTYTTGDRLDVQLTSTGTWTIVIEDNANDTAGSYSMSLLNVTGGPHENGSDSDGELIVSNDIKTGQFQQGVDFDAFTFAGTAGNRVIVVGLATGAGSHNPQLSVYPPGGGAAEISSATDRFDLQLGQTGTYTLVIEDSGNDHTGTYLISLMNVTAGPYTNGSDLDGGAIVSADVKTGTMSGPGDIDCFTFSGTNGQRVLMDGVATAGAGFNTTILLYPPNGGPWLTYTTGDRLDVQLTSTGTWTIVIEDNANDTAGSYSMSLLNVTGGPHENGSDSDGELIVSNDIKTGQFQQGVDFDAFTFTSGAGRRLIFVGLATGAGTHNPQLSVYPPGGGGAIIASATDRFDVAIAVAGTYTLVVEDSGNDDTGTYTIAMMNVTSGPFVNGNDPNGGLIVSNDIVAGTMSGPGDIDVFQFQGFEGNRVLMSAIATGGAGFNTTILLYPPGGGPWLTYTTGDRLDVQLPSSGTWSISIEDNANDTAGNYTMSFLNVTEGPYTSGGESDGGAIAEGVTETGSAFSAADFDGYTFYGIAGQIYTITATKTSGNMDTQTSLYPPGGGNPIISTSTDVVVTPALATGGYYTIVIEDVAQDQTGNYSLLLDQTGGPTDIGDRPPVADLALLPGSPSPFANATRLGFTLPAGGRVELNVFDVRGARVRSLAREHFGAGTHGVTWDGRDDRGARVASGVYYVQLAVSGKVRLQKVVLVR